MKIAVVTLPVSGHLNPMLALARRIRQSGHDVTVISVPDVEERALATGLKFITVGADAFPLNSTRELERLFSTQTGEAALKFTFDLMGHVTGTLLRPLTRALQSEDFAGVVFDTYQVYLELAAIHLALPYAHVASAAYFDVSGETPLCFFDWPDDKSEQAKARNQEGVERFRALLQPSVAVARAYADEVGIEVNWGDLAATLSKRAWITQIPAAFDFGTGASPSGLIHTGPFIDSSGRNQVKFPWERLTGAPLVYASMGTLQNGVPGVFQAIADAARQRPDLQFVIVSGRNMDPASFPPLPGNALFVPQAPQLDLLKRAALCITHAGLNTTLEALASGVPLIAIPVTNDQPGVAARIRHHQVGDFIPVSELSGPRLGNVIDKVWGSNQFRRNAEVMKAKIAEQDGLSLAAAVIVEQLGRPDVPLRQSRAHAK